MNTTYFGFAIADGMFRGNVTITRTVLNIDQVKELIGQGASPCLNPSHESTIRAMNSRFNINVTIPAVAPKVNLAVGDKVIVMSVRGLPRLDATRHEYTDTEIASATFEFSLWEVIS